MADLDNLEELAKAANPVEEALAFIKTALDFAYDQGLHEVGFDPLTRIRQALARRDGVSEPVAWRGEAIPLDCPYPSLGSTGAPYAYNIDPGAGSAMDRLQRDWPSRQQVLDLRKRDGRITPLYPPSAHPAPASVIGDGGGEPCAAGCGRVGTVCDVCRALHPAPASVPDITGAMAQAAIRKLRKVATVDVGYFDEPMIRSVILAALRQPDTAAKDACMARGSGEAVMTGIQLEGRQGEPAGMMTVKATMSDGSERVLIQDSGNVISHWKNLAALRTTPADPRPDPRDEALREAREAISAARKAFGNPMVRRALGGHNEDQMEAILKGREAEAKINAVMGEAG